MDFYEEITISLLDSTNPEHGYNLKTGGNHSRASLETRERMRISRLAYTLPKPSQETKDKISKTIIDNIIRYDHNGNRLPKYIKFINWKDRCGYAIVSHPKCKVRYFVEKNCTLESKLSRCVEFLQNLIIPMLT